MDQGQKITSPSFDDNCRKLIQRHSSFVISENSIPVWIKVPTVQQCTIIARSLRHWTGRELFPGTENEVALAKKSYEAPFVLVSHGIESDPVLNFGNLAAQALWEMPWEELTRIPSRLTAEAPNREERARLLQTVSSRGFIEDYSGIRISKSGRRFRIDQATVWNLLTTTHQPCGQAAMFDRWTFL